jgi:hypothetical protein
MAAAEPRLFERPFFVVKVRRVEHANCWSACQKVYKCGKLNQ